MNLGVSTACLYPLETEDALEALIGLGIPAAEVFINTDRELNRSYCRAMHHRAQEGGVRLLSLHPYTSGFEPFLFFSNYPRRFEDGRRYYRRIFKAAQLLGAPLVVFHGGRRDSPLSYEEYFERYALLMADAQEEGVILAHENVSRCVGYDPEFFRQMKLALPNAAFVLDVKQAVRSDVSPYEMARAMCGNIHHIHLSDQGPAGDCLPFGKGELDLRRLLTAVGQQPIPSAVLELYRHSYGELEELHNSYKILAETFKCSSSGTLC